MRKKSLTKKDKKKIILEWEKDVCRNRKRTKFDKEVYSFLKKKDEVELEDLIKHLKKKFKITKYKSHSAIYRKVKELIEKKAFTLFIKDNKKFVKLHFYSHFYFEGFKGASMIDGEDFGRPLI